MDQILDMVTTAVAWLDRTNGRGDHELTLRILKVTEEAGEACGAWIGVLGQNPRKGVTHTKAEVAAELADVAFTALVAIESLGLGAGAVLAECAGKIASRLEPDGSRATASTDGYPDGAAVPVNA